MLYLKTRYFARWVRREGITDSALCEAIREFESGLFEASLGNHLFKKRIALPGRGKSGGARTILFYQQDEKIVFCTGYVKNVKDDLNESEIKALHKLSKDLQVLGPAYLDELIRIGELIQLAKKEE